MSFQDKTLHLCTCNGTLPLDGQALARALEIAGPLPLHHQLCQKELGALTGRPDADALVACTQEAEAFRAACEESGRPHPLRFVNSREAAGWSAEARAATPKIAALLKAAALPEPDPVPRVTYR